MDIFTHITHPSLPPSTILVLQFRAPVDKISVEFPAGLIDGGETPEQAALRELAEETGYGSDDYPATKGKVTHVSRVCADSPGMSTETTVFVTVKVELDDSVKDFPEPKQNLDEGEFVRASRAAMTRPLTSLLDVFRSRSVSLLSKTYTIRWKLTPNWATWSTRGCTTSHSVSSCPVASNRSDSMPHLIVFQEAMRGLYQSRKGDCDSIATHSKLNEAPMRKMSSHNLPSLFLSRALMSCLLPSSTLPLTRTESSQS